MKWHIDPGHGWLEVSIVKLIKLGIANKISPYSYQKGDKAYLEEDCDAAVFFEAYFKDPMWFTKEACLRETQSIPEKLYKSDATVRNYDSYQGAC